MDTIVLQKKFLFLKIYNEFLQESFAVLKILIRIIYKFLILLKFCIHLYVSRDILFLNKNCKY